MAQKIVKEKLKRIPKDMRKVTVDDVESVKEISNVKKKGRKHVKFGFWTRRKLKTKPEHCFLITMFFANGTSKTFVITTNELLFKVKKRHYYLYYEESTFDLSMNAFHLFYHEHYPVPINREVQLLGEEAYFSVSPENIKDFVSMKYISALSGSNRMDKWVRIMMILLVIVLVVSILALMKVWGS